MRNELKRHKQNDKIKWTLTAVAFVLFAVLLAGVCLQVFGHGKMQPSEWFKKANGEQTMSEYEFEERVINNEIMHVGSLIQTNQSASDVISPYGSYSLPSWWDEGVRVRLSQETVDIGASLWDDVGFVEDLKEFDCSEFLEYLDLRYRHSDREIYDFPLGENVPGTSYYLFVSEFTAPIFDGFLFSGFSVLYKLDDEYYWKSFNLHECAEGYVSEYLGIKGTSIPSLCMKVSLHYVNEPKVAIPLPPDPIKEGHTFLGWYNGTQDSCDNHCVKYNGTNMYEDTDLHAHFAINEYTVTYDSAGGSVVNSATVNWNTVAPLSTPTRTGYNFTGWFLVDGTEYTNQPVTEDITLTAHWEIKTFTVTFYVDGEKYFEKVVEWGDRFVKIEEHAAAQNLQITSLRSSSGTPIIDFDKLAVTEDIDVQAEVMTGADKLKNTVKNNWLTIACSAGGIILLVVLLSALFSRKKKKAYRC